jgi:GntR family transcriptional regulator
MAKATAARSKPKKEGLSVTVAEGIRAGISEGEYPIGSRLPPEVEFAGQLGVSRSTLREALKLLEREGLIVRRQRAGTTVSAQPAVQHPLQRNYGVREMVEDSGKQHGVIDAEIRFVEASEKIAAALEVESATQLVVLERTRTADGKPVVRTVDYLDSEIVSGATAPVLPDVSFYRWMFDHCGIAVTHGVAHVTATVADAGLAKRLGVKEGAPLLRLTQVDYTSGGRPVLYSEEFHIAEAFDVTVIRNGPFDR